MKPQPSQPENTKQHAANLLQSYAYLDSGEDLSRLAGLSDGLFAIALTLLVLELKPPDLQSASNRDLANVLLALAPQAFGFVLSFAVGGFYWLMHHRIVNLLERYDRGLLQRNLLFLFFVSLLPFSSALQSRYGNLSLAWTVYALNIIAIGVTLTAMIRHAFRHGLMHSNVTTSFAHFLILRGSSIPIIFLLSIGISLLSPRLASASPTLILVYVLLLNKWYTTRPAPAPGQ